MTLINRECTICPGSSDPVYIVTYYIKWGHYFLDTQYNKKNHDFNIFQILVSRE